MITNRMPANYSGVLLKISSPNPCVGYYTVLAMPAGSFSSHPSVLQHYLLTDQWLFKAVHTNMYKYLGTFAIRNISSRVSLQNKSSIPWFRVPTSHSHMPKRIRAPPNTNK